MPAMLPSPYNLTWPNSAHGLAQSYVRIEGFATRHGGSLLLTILEYIFCVLVSMPPSGDCRKIGRYHPPPYPPPQGREKVADFKRVPSPLRGEDRGGGDGRRGVAVLIMEYMVYNNRLCGSRQSAQNIL